MVKRCYSTLQVLSKNQTQGKPSSDRAGLTLIMKTKLLFSTSHCDHFQSFFTISGGIPWEYSSLLVQGYLQTCDRNVNRLIWEYLKWTNINNRERRDKACIKLIFSRNLHTIIPHVEMGKSLQRSRFCHGLISANEVQRSILILKFIHAPTEINANLRLFSCLKWNTG